MHETILAIQEYLWQIIMDYWLAGLFWIVYTEAFIQPVPVDPLIVASANYLSVWSVLWVVFLWTILWSATWYALGKYLWEPIFIKIFWQAAFTKWHIFMEKWWILWVIIAGISPIPYKLITWLAWIFEMNFWTFILAWIAWRMPRFILMFYFWEYLATLV